MKNNIYYFIFPAALIIFISLLYWSVFHLNKDINCSGDVNYLRNNVKVSTHIKVDSSVDRGFFSVEGFVDNGGGLFTISRNIIFKSVKSKGYTILTVSNIDISMEDEVSRSGMDKSLPDFLTKKGTELGLLINHQNGELKVNSRGLLTFICTK